MKHLLLVIPLAGCAASDSDYPILVQGGTTASSGATGNIAGRVCVLTDLQQPTACAASGAGGLEVTVGSAAAITADDGSFVLTNAIIGPGASVVVTGPQIVPSVQPIGTTNVVPVIGSPAFDAMLDTNNITLEPNMGSVLARVVNGNGEPIAGITAASTPAAAFGPFFDSTAASGSGTLASTATGNQGVAFFPGLVPPGPVTITFNPSDPTDQSTISDVRILEGGVSFVNAELAE